MTLSRPGRQITPFRLAFLFASALAALNPHAGAATKLAPPSVPTAGASALTIPHVFGDHMVVQAGMPVPVWGWANPGEQIVVQFAGQERETAAAPGDGRWEVRLDPLTPSAEGRTLRISGSQAVEFYDVLVGEVWLASGQSNMAKSFGPATHQKPIVNYQEELRQAGHPLIRLFQADPVRSAQPARDYPVKRKPSARATLSGWAVCSPSSVDDLKFSAVAYFFGRKLNQELNVPVGLINVSVGGTQIEPWTPGPGGVLYNGMIAPVAGFGLRGIIWYQGESNVYTCDGDAYFPKMKALIEGWRSAWQRVLPFYYVQVAPLLYHATRMHLIASPEEVPLLWEAQTAAFRLPHTGMVVTTDLVEDLFDLHPPQKRPVGDRLAGWALRNEYGRDELEVLGPLFQRMEIKGNQAILHFDHVGGGLVVKGSQPLTWFTIAGADGHFAPGEAKIVGDTVIVSSPKVPAPTVVRFAWDEAARPNFFNRAGLPAVPFRTNNPLAMADLAAERELPLRPDEPTNGPPAIPRASIEEPTARVAALRLPGVVITLCELNREGDFPPHTTNEEMRHLPPFCRVAATLVPSSDSCIRMEVWLPLEQWNGRLLGVGNGGGAGSIGTGTMALGLRRAFAVVNSDLGTAPNAEDWSGHPERWTDFGGRAPHEMTIVAKAVIQAFYGRPAEHAYFAAGSTGGQEAISEAQRHPDDYDGIVAGCPANNRTHLHTMFLWDWRALNETPESRLKSGQPQMIVNAVIKEMAGRDGGAPGDNFLTDPRLSRFESRNLLGQLTQAQVRALEKIHAGPVNPRTGERIYTAIPYGGDAYLGAAVNVERIFPFILKWGLGAEADPRTFDFDHDMDTLDHRLGQAVNVNSPDLSAFRGRGGKLLMYTGTADGEVPMGDAINYYERVIAAQGSLSATQEFFRYFIVPGMKHGYGGPGLGDFGQNLTRNVPADRDHDILLALQAWVEEGVAPDRIIATAHVGAGNSTTGVRMQRPLFPYPKFPEYQGGDPTLPESFKGVDHARGVVQAPAPRYVN